MVKILIITDLMIHAVISTMIPTLFLNPDSSHPG